MPQSTSPDEFDIFGVDPDRRSFFAPSDQLPPDVGLAEGLRVVELRMGFLQALLTDPRVVDQLRAWVAAVRAYALAVRDGAPRDHPGFPVVALLKDLKIPEPWWAWCCVELIHVWQRMAAHNMTDPREALLPMKGAVLAPLLAIQFVTERGESTTEALNRWEALDAQVRAEIKAADTAAVTKEKRAPGGDRAYLRTRGRWVYERLIRQPPRTVTDIARENHGAHHPGTFEDHECRKQVREAIIAAQRLLGLTLPAFLAQRDAEKHPPGL